MLYKAAVELVSHTATFDFSAQKARYKFHSHSDGEWGTAALSMMLMCLPRVDGISMPRQSTAGRKLFVTGLRLLVPDMSFNVTFLRFFFQILP